MLHETILTRENGTVIKIITEVFTNVDGTNSHDTFILSKSPDDTNWIQTSSGYPTVAQREHAMAMPRGEYIKSGRPPMFSHISIAELLKNVRDAFSEFNKCNN